MTEQAFNRSKSNMLTLLNQHVESQKAKLDILRSYKLQAENTHTEEDLKQLHKEIYKIISE